ncbi:uncharacterized protein LOC100368543 [Saccoglossus kowalevskii]|uniref:Centromere protein F-like n=1 Tax=Saccoglossus kowalevskii TaxID=10224 RepID=A0ABM0H022_SACKO|nr:PREDICTED: centromere protein F-like [Saccoglossus kowalevskii]
MADFDVKDVLDQQQSLLDEFHNGKSSLQQRMAEVSEEDKLCKMKLPPSKTEFHKLKITYKSLQSKINFYELINTAKENWPTLSSIEDEIKANKSKFEGLREEIENIKEEMKELTEKAQTAQEQKDQNVALMDEKMQLIEAKKNKFVELREKYNKVYNSYKKRGVSQDDIDSVLASQRKQLNVANEAIMQYEDTLQSRKLETDNFKAESEEIRQRVNIATASLGALNNQKQEKAEEITNNLNWCHEMCKILSYMGRISDPVVEEDSIHLEIASLAPNCKPLIVSMHFTKQSTGDVILSDAKTNIMTLVTDDVITAGVKDNDVLFLLNEIIHRYDCHAPLLGEMEDLRSKYAIDWIVDERKVKLMIADNVHNVCTLCIEEGYPITGGVLLKSIDGSDVSLDNLKPPMPNPSITDWIHYLHIQLSKEMDV